MNTSQTNSSYQISSVARSIEEILNDPHMKGDKVEELTELLTSIRTRLIAERWREADDARRHSKTATTPANELAI